ncbi:MAG: hypothetical protein ILO68_00585 [Clostridia bacterium]|nr:hypothetical protein [Clostridia bacterium]
MADDRNAPITSPEGLKLLITVVGSAKADYYADLIQHYGANMQIITAAEGTARAEVLNLLGLSDSRKNVIFSIIRSDVAERALGSLAEEFRTVKNGKGVAFTVPLTSVIGVLAYRFLSHRKDS